jgi:hypothetical protein
LEQRGITASGFNFHIRAGIGEIQCLRVINEKLKIPKSFPAADIGKLNITSRLSEVSRSEIWGFFAGKSQIIAVMSG